MKKSNVCMANLAGLLLLILTAMLFIIPACSNMLDLSETPPIEPGDEFSLVTSTGGSLTATALDLDDDGIIDGIDLDGVTTTAEVDFDSDSINENAGIYPVDLDNDGNVDFYILVDYDGAIVANAEIDNEGQAVIIIVDGSSEPIGIDYNDDYQGSDYSLGAYPPEAPLSLTVTPGNKELTLNWAAVLTATSYSVYYNTINNSGSATLFPDPVDDTDTTCTITGLDNGTLYYIWLQATNADGTSDYSTATGTPVDTIPPTAGNSGTITTASVAETSLTLNWTAATDETSLQSALEYRAYYSTSNNLSSVAEIEANGTAINSYTANITTVDVIGLTAGITYYFNLIVRDEAGNKTAYTTVSQATTADSTPPTAGNSGTITTASVASTSLTLNWTAATDDTSAQSALEYRAYYSTSNNLGSVANIEANGTAINSYTANITTVGATGLTASTTYYFNLIVRDEAGNQTAYTTVSQATAAAADGTPPTAGNSGTITTASVASTSLTLNWTAASDDTSAQSALEYRVYRSASNNIDTVANIEANGTAINSYTANIATLDVTGLTASTTYYFNLIVRDEASNQTAYTTVSQATSAAADTTDPTAGNSGTITTASVASTSLTLNWTVATDDTSAQSALEYRVYRSTSNNLGSVANIEANGTAINSYTANIATLDVTGLTASTTYYFNLIVRDEAGNQTAYSTVTQATTTAAPDSYLVAGYDEDGTKGEGTYTKEASDHDGKVSYKFYYATGDFNFFIRWSTANSRWQLENGSYSGVTSGTDSDAADADWDYYIADSGDTPPASGWTKYTGEVVDGDFTVTAQ